MGRRTFLGALSTACAFGAAALAGCKRTTATDSETATATATATDAAPADEGPSAPLMAPADLSARLADVRAGKVVVLQVGFEYLFHKEHVPGSRWVGEASTHEGTTALEAALKAIPADVEVVAYCGCCPFSHCPNLHPARHVLSARGKASFLDLPTNFRTDWIDKGYAVESG